MSGSRNGGFPLVEKFVPGRPLDIQRVGLEVFSSLYFTKCYVFCKGYEPKK